MNRPLRLGIVGGGPGSFIGPVHRMAAELDGDFQLVAGAFSRDPNRTRQAASVWGIDSERAYGDFLTMMNLESGRVDGIDAVAIVTPNHLHFPIAVAALQAGIHVICDKPAAISLDEARRLQALVKASGRHYALTYTYTGYPMVREARALVHSGALGTVRKVVVEYAQGWLSEAIEQAGHKQASWRLDPAQTGIGGCVADIGVHAFNLAEFVSGRRVVRVCADLSSVVAGRLLDDDCNMLLRFDNGAPGVLMASQIAAGERNHLRLKIYGEKGGLKWSHEAPTTLITQWLERPSEVRHTAGSYLAPDAQKVSRLPAGHPEGYIGAFANLYRDFATVLRGGDASMVQGIGEGVRGMGLIEAAVASSHAGGIWVSSE